MRNTALSTLLAALFTFCLSKPASSQVMLGAYLPGDGWDVAEIDRFNKYSAKPLAFVTLFTAFSHNWHEHLKYQAGNIYSTGAIPLITWMPIDLEDPERNLLSEIASGEWDEYIDNWIAGLLEWLASYPISKRPMILLRFAHEFNGHWYPYAGEPVLYIVAWRRLHDRFQAAGANEFVEWVWNANHISFDDYNDITKYYPGNYYVDWTAIDGYNWGTNHDWTNWDSFETVFAAAYDTMVTHFPEKPILIAEYGSTEPHDLPTEMWGQRGSDVDQTENRAEWFFDMLTSIEENFPAIRGLGLFGNDKELSWSLTNADSTGLVGFNLGLQSDYFTPNFLCARVMPPNMQLPDIEPREMQSGPTTLVPRSLLNPRVFSHAINTRKPPEALVQEAQIKSRSYRTKVRSKTEDERASMSIKRYDMLEY